MKRLAALAVVVAMSAVPACAQHGGGSHGGFSGSHSGGFSAPGGFSGGHGGFSAPSYRGGSGALVGSGPPRYAGGPSGPRVFNFQPPSVRTPYRVGGMVPGASIRPPQYASNRIPYPGRGLRPVAPMSSVSRRFNTGTSRRMPYNSPHDGVHASVGWNHWHGYGWNHYHHGFYGYYGWVGYPYLPWWGWGYYPILPASWDYWNYYDSQPGGNYPASQYPEYLPAPYDQPAPDQPEPQQPEYTPWPNGGPAPSANLQAPAAPSPEAPVTLVFKDGRPNEQIHNYLLTATTLSVLDQRRRDIPVAQIDFAATTRLNRAAGVEFVLPPR